MTYENIVFVDGSTLDLKVFFVAETVVLAKDDKDLFYLINRERIEKPSKYKKVSQEDLDLMDDEVDDW